MIKKLDVYIPFVSTLPEYNALFACFSDKEKIVWIYSYMIQLEISNNAINNPNLNFCCGDSRNLFFNSGLLEVYKIPIDFVNTRKGIRNFIYNEICKKRYVLLTVDKFYIQAYAEYNDKHIRHEILVYGYNDSNFYIADFFGYKYEMEECPYEQLEKAYESANSFEDNNGFTCIYTFEKNVNCSLSVDAEMIRTLLKEYEGGINSNSHFWPVNNPLLKEEAGLCFGLNTYSVLRQHLNNSEHIQIRSFHILYEHKKMLQALWKSLNDYSYIQNYDIVSKELSNIVDKAEACRNMVFKLAFSDSVKNRKKAIECLDNLHEKEEKTIGIIISSLLKEAIIIDKRAKKENSCFFSGMDEHTHGDYQKKYGRLGYILFGNTRNINEDISYIDGGFILKYWKTLNDNKKAINLGNNERLSACKGFINNAWCEILLMKKTKVSFYCFEGFGIKRLFSVYIYDASNNLLIYKTTLSVLNSSIYASFICQGHLRFEFKNESENMGVVSAVYFDPYNKDEQ